MEIQQLELDLWQSLETGVKFPQTTDFPKLCNVLAQAMVASRKRNAWSKSKEHTATGIAEQSIKEQLLLGAEAIYQLLQVYAAWVELLLCDWERRY